MIYRTFLKPVLFRMDPEAAHDAAIHWGERCQQLPGLLTLFNRVHRYQDDRLVTTVAGIRFDNPIGLAAGFDKSARMVDLLASLGFGHIEIGSVSMDASAGNPKPRLWRLPEDRAALVHYGLPNDGSICVAERLSRRTSSTPLGVNLVNTNRSGDGAALPNSTSGGSARRDCNNESAGSSDAILEDYVVSATRLQPAADYFMLNLSCPNTVDGRSFFDCDGHLDELLRRLHDQQIVKPIFLKLSPDTDDRGLEELLRIVAPYANVRGFMFNLSPKFRQGLRTPRERWADLPGAISGQPIRDWMDDRVTWLHQRIDTSRYHILAAGGVASGEDAYRKIRRGASLVQLYTGLLYQGPSLVKRICRELADCLRRDGFDTVAQAVGSEQNHLR